MMPFDISVFKGRRVLVLGDLMLDEYLWGSVDRISPEAPVQVVSVDREEFTLGGAGNVVNNLVSLGAEAVPVGVMGDDGAGEKLVERFGQLGVSVAGILREPGRQTSRKARVIAANQQVLRIDRETRRPVSESVGRSLADFLARSIPHVDIVLISDYGKGVLTDTVLAAVTDLCRKSDKLAIGDPKGLDFTKYAGLSLLTPNRKEAAQASGIDIADIAGLKRAGAALMERVGLERLLITCGKEGMVLFEEGREPLHIPARARQVFDVSGAGDTVLSIMGLALSAGATFPQAAELANAAAGIVVGKMGTATVTAEELLEAVSPADGISRKHVRRSELALLVRGLKQSGRRIVLTNGCFDLLHAGHVKFLAAAKRLADVLIVAIDDDDSVRRIKGARRPVISERQRVRILSALDAVDYVVVFATDELNNLIQEVRPDVLTKGSNYRSGQVAGKDLVEQLGGRVELIPITDEISASRIIEAIKNGE